jgi:hypothetical protein
MITKLLAWAHRVNVFSLGKNYLSQISLLANSSHLGTRTGEGIIFGKHIDASALFYGTAKRNAECGRRSRHSFGKDVDTFFKRFYCVFGVLMEIIAEHYCINA